MSESTSASSRTSHSDVVPGAVEFEATRVSWRNDLGADEKLRRRAADLQQQADQHHYGYTWEWLGIPIIRLPDDVVVLQEIFWKYRPQCVIETGVARGGSMVLNASLMQLCGQKPSVLGIDLKVFNHTIDALDDHPFAEGIDLLEADSTSSTAEDAVRRFLDGVERAVLILDSNHTHEHVLAELRLLAPLLPVGSYVLVADTLIEEFPEGYYVNRPWDRGNNPATALRQFIAESADFEIATEWARRALMTEFRDGILLRVSA